MNSSFCNLSVASCLFLAIVSPFPVLADQTIIDAPGVHINAGDAGTSIIAPGVRIDTPTASREEAIPTIPPTIPLANHPYVPSTNTPASTTSYSNASLPNMDFRNQNLAGADFTNSTLSGTNFSGSNLAGAKFTNASLQNTNFTNANLQGAKMSNSQLDGALLTNADLSQADLTNASLRGTNISGTHFSGAVLTNVDMSQALHEVIIPTSTPTAQINVVDSTAIASALVKTHKIDLTVNFDFNSDKLTPDGARQVQQIAAALTDPSLQRSHIRVEGHTDNVGGDAYNQGLSTRRANSVLNSLVTEYHIPSAMLTAQGFGKTQPIASNDIDLGRAKNRRVTLVNLGE